MEKVLELYKYIDGVQTPFPNSDEQVIVASFRCDYARMGAAPTITFSVNHPMCLDDLWSKDVFATFNGERFFLKQIPTSSFSNQDARYKHDVELISERSVLDYVYFYDVVASGVSYDKPVSNSSKFSFFGDVKEYAKKLEQSLEWSKVGYSIVVDEGVSSNEELVSFENQVITNALQEIYNIYKIPYYFVGKTIHIGEYKNNVDKVFKYGVDDSLLSISKNNANSKIVNRITGVGSQDNIPYYYPNDDEKGVTRALLNGAENGVSIVDTSKYRKVRMSDIFKYYSSVQTLTNIVTTSQYTRTGFKTLVGVDEEYRYLIDTYYKFTLPQFENVRFSVSSSYESNEDLKYEVVKTTGVSYGSTSEDKTLALTGGSYEVSVRWVFTSPTPLDWFEQERVDEVIQQYLSVDASIVVDATNAWTLNGVPTQLSKYGLSVDTPSNGDIITFERVSYILPQPSLMPPIYRNSYGDKRFYDAKNNTYVNFETGEYFHFENEYSNTQPREHIENFDTIRPTIKNVTNGSGERIDSFIDFAYDEYDNDEVDENNKYIHPYFFAKLRKFDGEYGFNLFDHAIDEGEMVVAMTGGSCGSCEFIIGVDEKSQKNIVQVDEYGNLKRDSKGNVIRTGSPQDVQNDTEHNEVWIALKKDVNTFGIIMPNASNNYRPIAGDTFVILHIDLPKKYIEAAEHVLELELLKFMEENNSEKFNFSISFSRIFFAENPSILEQLSENSKIQIEYNKQVYDLYISSLSYSMDGNSPLPDIKVELSDVITISQNAISQVVASTKKEILSTVEHQVVVWNDIKGVPSWISSEKPRYSYSELSGVEERTEYMWEVKTLSDGTKYVYTPFNVVTQQGITTYSDNTTLDLPSIYKGLPIDMDTIYWDGNVLKSKGSGEGSLVGFEITGEGNALTNVSSSGDKLVFTKGATFVEKSYVDDNFFTREYIADTYYTKKHIDDTFYTKKDADGLFVTLDESQQEILGIKTFKNGLNIGTSKVWQSQDDVVYIDANVVVRGALTIFGLNEVDIPNFWEGLPIDDNTLVRDDEGVLMVNPNIELGGGASTWDELQGKPEWITYDKPEYVYSEIKERPDLSVYALKDDLNSYMTLGGNESVEGIKDFVNGILIDGIGITKSQDGVVYIDGHLVVRDGVTLYGESIVDIPLFMESLLLDGNTLALNEKGELTVIGGTGGGSIEYALSWSGFSSGSYDGSEAKTIYIPSKVSELTNDSSYITSSALSGYATESYVTTRGYITSSALNGYATESYVTSRGYITSSSLSGYATETWVNNKGYVTSSALGAYLPLTGGTLSGGLTVGGDLKCDGTYSFFTMENSYGLYFKGLAASVHKNHSYHNGVWVIESSGRILFSQIPLAGDLSLATEAFVRNGYLPLSGGTITGELWLNAGYLNVKADQYGDSFVRFYNQNGTSLLAAIGVRSTTKPVFYDYGVKQWLNLVYNTNWCTLNTDSSSNPYLLLRHSSGTTYYVQNYNSYLYLGSTSTKSLRIDTNGNCLAVGGITMYSDQRKKTIINHVQLSLKEVADAPLIEHYYNSDERKTTHVGSIAQYWAGLNDWFCKADDDGFYTMEIQNAALASAISVARELLKYETKTDKQIRRLKKRIHELEEEIEKLKG